MDNLENLPQERDTEPALGAPKYGPESFLLFSTGFACTVGGLALAAAPHFSWKLAKIAQALFDAGLESGSLITGGMALIGMGVLARLLPHAVQAGHAAVQSPASSGVPSQDLDTLVAQVGSLSTRFSDLENALQSVSRNVAQAGSQKAAPAPQIDHEELSESISRKLNDALFRMAASMDKMGARLEQQVERKVERPVEDLKRTVDELSATATRQAMTPQEMADAVATQQQAERALAETATVPASAAVVQEAPAAPEAQPVAQVAQVAQVEPGAEQIAGLRHDAPHEPLGNAAPEQMPAGLTVAQHTEAQAPVDAQPAQVAQPHPEPAAPAPAQGHPALAGNPTEPQPALPDQPQGQQAQPGEPGSLESLLPDYRVREAIEHNRRGSND